MSLFPMDLQAEVDAVDWARLRHAYGRASDVAEDLRGLGATEAETRRRALRRLNTTILHQGSVYSASVAAAALLVRILEVTPEQIGVLELLLGLALGDDANAWIRGGLPYGRAAQRRKRRDKEFRVYRAVEAGLDSYVASMASPNAPVRRMATYLVGWFGDRSQDILPKLRERMSLEDDPIARGSLWLALGLLGHYRSNDEDAVNIGTALDADGHEQLAAAVALALLGGQSADDRVESILRDWSSRVDERAQDLPWFSGEPAGLADVALRRVVPEHGVRALDLAIDRLEQRASADNVGRVLSAVFEPRSLPRSLADPELDEHQERAILAVLACDLPAWQLRWSLSQHGLSRSPDRLRCQLGQLPATPMEREVDLGESGPEIVWSACASMAQRRLDPDDLGSALQRSLSVADVVRVAVTMASDRDFLPDSPSAAVDDAAARNTEIAVDWLERLGDEAFEPLRAQAGELASAPFEAKRVYGQDPGLHRAATAVAAALVRRYRSRREDPAPDLDRLFERVTNAHRELEREVFAAIPEPRREGLILRRDVFEPSRERIVDGKTRHSFVALGAWWLFDLCPTRPVADRVVGLVCERGREEWLIEPLVRSTLAAMGEHGCDAIVAALAASPKRRDLLLAALGDLGDVRGLDVLIDSLGERAKTVNAAAIDALTRFPARLLRPALEQAATERRGRVRKASLALLRQIGADPSD